MDTLFEQGVFGKPRRRQPNEKVISTMFVLKAKSDLNGMLEKVKARLTLRGDLEKGVDFLSYAPVMLLATLRILISLHTADLSVCFHQLDITAAFVSARTKRKIVVSLTRGYGPPGSKHDDVYDLLFNLYGSVDAARVFYDDYVSFHVGLGFKKIHYDRCYLQKIEQDGSFIKLCLHVDDSAIAQRGIRLWKWYLDALRSKYKFRVGPLTYFLGMRFTRNAVRALLGLCPSIRRLK